MKRLLILLFLISVIVVSGCVDQETLVIGPATDGVVIKDFSFDSPTVYEGDSVGLNLEVQNVGEVEGTVEDITLFGPDLTDWSVTGPTPSITVALSPSEPEVDFEGEARSTRWRVTAPDVTAETPYTFGTRVIYDYETFYTGTLRVVTYSYLETLQEEERRGLLESGGVVSSTVTGGPLSVKPMKGRNFIVSSGGGGTSSLVFELTNLGSGYPSSNRNINEDTMYKVEISSSSGLTGCDSYGETTVRLSKGEKRLFSCNFGIPDVVNKEDIIFTIEFDYYYYVDGMTSINVAQLPEV